MHKFLVHEHLQQELQPEFPLKQQVLTPKFYLNAETDFLSDR